MCLYIFKVYSLQAKEKTVQNNYYNIKIQLCIKLKAKLRLIRRICDFTEEKKFTGANIYYTYIFINILYVDAKMHPRTFNSHISKEHLALN